MFKLKYIRKYTYRRNNNVFKKVYGKRTLSKNSSFFQINPYSKIKTIFNIELASLAIFLLQKTKISANLVSIFGFFWILLGVILLNLNHNILVYSGIIILFFKLVPDYIDGSLASLRKEISLTGFELDSWAGDVGKTLVLAGFFLYGIENNPFGKIDFFYIIFLTIIIFSLSDLRLFLSKYKKVYFDKFLKAHVKKEKNKKKYFKKAEQVSYIINFLKFLHFDGSSKYTDFLLLLIVIEKIYNLEIVYIFSIIWSVTFSLTFLKSLYLTLKD